MAATTSTLKIKSQYGTIAVFTRNHIGFCTLTDPNDNHCSCPKWIYANRKGAKPVRYAAQTPSAAEAWEKAKHEHDGWHPEIGAAREAAAKRTRRRKRVADAVEEIIAERQIEGSKGTRDSNRSLLGHVDQDGKVRGHFLTWLEEINRDLGEDRIEFMDQLELDLLLRFRTWGLKRFTSDLSRRNFWGKMRGFFHWALQHGYIERNPISTSKSPAAKKGNRCGAFTEPQFEDILAVIPRYARQQYAYGRLAWDAPYRAVLEQRLTIFVLLMRYSGMAIIDAALFSPFVSTDGLGLDDHGVLRYRRQKSGELAVVPIEDTRLLKLVRAGIPLEKFSDPHRPFVERDFIPDQQADMDTVTQKWARQLKVLYKLAGIEQIKTEVGWKAPHSHMFRDTFAKWHLNRHTSIFDLSKMLGHASVSTTQQHYSSWLAEDQQAMIDRVRSRNAPGGSSANVVRMPSLRQQIS